MADVVVPASTRSCELVLCFIETDDLFDGLRRYAARRHLASRVIDGRLRPGTPAPEMLIRNARSWRSNRGDWHDPARLAHAKQSDLGAVDIVSRLQILEGRHRVAGKILERCRVPVAARFAHAPFVVSEHGDAVTDQEADERQNRFRDSPDRSSERG